MTSEVLLALAVFGACVVESVEALTLVLASGTTTGWRSAFEGTAAALVVLGVLVAAVGVPLVSYVPIDVLRVVIGALLLVLGLGWLRKAVLRASGHKALHDEDAIFARTTAGLSTRSKSGSSTRNALGFVVAFKGVLLEGLEVVLIVISLGVSSHHLGLAVVMAAAAALAVGAVGALVARQLREVPENTMKLGVGVMLTSFGLFWVGEGSGLSWPGSDAFVLVLIAAFVCCAVLLSRWLSGLRIAETTTSAVQDAAATARSPRRALLVEAAARATVHFVVDFLVGDAPELFAGVLVVVALSLGLRHDRLVAMPLVCVLSLLLLVSSTYRGRERDRAGEHRKNRQGQVL